MNPSDVTLSQVTKVLSLRDQRDEQSHSVRYVGSMVMVVVCPGWVGYGKHMDLLEKYFKMTIRVTWSGSGF